MLRTTHTTARLEVSRAAYDEVRRLLEEAGYQHTFQEDGSIDMSGIALAPAAVEESRE